MSIGVVLVIIVVMAREYKSIATPISTEIMAPGSRPAENELAPVQLEKI